MQNIELINIYHKDFKKSLETYKIFCKKNNISLIQQELDSPITSAEYIPVMLGTLYSTMFLSTAEWIIVCGPYTAINNFNFEIEKITDCGSDVILSAPIKNSRILNFYFFALKNNAENKALLRKILAIDVSVAKFGECAAKNSRDMEAYSKKVLSLFNDLGVKYSIFTIQDIFYFNSAVNPHPDFFLASYADEDISHEASYVNLEMKIDLNIKNIELEKHYDTDTCIVSLFTDNIKNQGLLSAESIKLYCDKNKISYKIYDFAILKNQPGNWSKTFAINEVFKRYNTVIWVDSDIVFTNPNKSILDISKNFDHSFIVCKDPSSDHFFNSGFMIFKKSDFSKKLLNYVCSDIIIAGDKSSVYSFGGDQAMLIKRCKELGTENRDYLRLPESVFNSHPVNWKEGDMVMHLMGYGGSFREKYMRYLLDKYSKEE